jgi:hypothetical protein
MIEVATTIWPPPGQSNIRPDARPSQSLLSFEKWTEVPTARIAIKEVRALPSKCHAELVRPLIRDLWRDTPAIQ